MSVFRAMLCAFALALMAGPVVAQEAEEAATATAEASHVAVAPADIVWGPAPAVLPAGAEMAVLSGDPSKEGPFVIRARMPDGYRIAAHSHPVVESVTVISGTFGVGMGETVQDDVGKELGPGGLFVMQPQTAHFAWTKGETVIQVHADGPWELNYVNPADDPRNAGEGAEPQGR
ncbi:MAG: cupin domain-containing protein [Gemmatimonadota bacterium]